MDEESDPPQQAFLAKTASSASSTDVSCTPVEDWEAFFARTKDVLQCRNPKVRNTFITNEIHSVAASSQVTSAQRTDLFLELVNNYALYRERPSKLVMRRAGAALLRSEAARSPMPLVDTEMVQRIDNALRVALDSFGDFLGESPGSVRIRVAGLHSWLCLVLHTLLHHDSENVLYASERWASLVYTYSRAFYLIESAWIPTKDKLFKSVNKAGRRLIYRNYEHVALLCDTMLKLVDETNKVLPAVPLIVIFDACLRLPLHPEHHAPGADRVIGSQIRRVKPALLELCVTRGFDYDDDLEYSMCGTFQLFLCALCSAEDVEEFMMPHMKHLLAFMPERAFWVAAELMNILLRVWNKRTRCLEWFDKYCYHKTAHPLRIQLMVVRAMGESLYSNLISGDPGASANAEEFAIALNCFYEIGHRKQDKRILDEIGDPKQVKQTLVDTLFQKANQADLCTPGRRASLFRALMHLSMPSGNAEVIASAMATETCPNATREAVTALMNDFYHLPPGGELPEWIASVIYAKLDSPNLQLRLVSLDVMLSAVSYACKDDRSLWFLPKNKDDAPRMAFIEQIFPALGKCLAQSEQHACESEDAALEACLSMMLLTRISASFNTPAVSHALQNIPVLREPLRVKPSPSFLLDIRVARQMQKIPLPPSPIKNLRPFALADALSTVLECKGVMPLYNPDVFFHLLEQLREQCRVPEPYSGNIEKVVRTVSTIDASLGAQLIYKTTQVFLEERRRHSGDLLFPIHKGFSSFLPHLLVPSHATEGINSGKTKFENIADEQHARVDLRKDIPARLEVYLAEIEAGSRIPVFREAAARAYATVLHYAGEDMISRMKSRM